VAHSLSLGGKLDNYFLMMMFRKKALTFIEILIALAILAIAFLPLMNMFSLGLEEGMRTGDVDTARYLAQTGMETMKNLAFTKTQLKNLGDVWEPALAQPPLAINGRSWRIYRCVKKNTDPLEIHIQVYEAPKEKGKAPTAKPLVDLVTLVEDFEWTGE
jgi:prepilin-type N-terminal cleavage/methylation domain-containing protein